MDGTDIASSIFRKHSLAPLLLSPDLLLQILHRHAISPHFLDLLAAFRVSDDLSGKGQALWSPLRIATDGYGEYSRLGRLKHTLPYIHLLISQVYLYTDEWT